MAMQKTNQNVTRYMQEKDMHLSTEKEGKNEKKEEGMNESGMN